MEMSDNRLGGDCAALAVGSVAFYLKPQWFGASAAMMRRFDASSASAPAPSPRRPSLLPMLRQRQARLRPPQPCGWSDHAGLFSTILLSTIGCGGDNGCTMLAFILIFIKIRGNNFDSCGRRIEASPTPSSRPSQERCACHRRPRSAWPSALQAIRRAAKHNIFKYRARAMKLRGV